MKKEWYSAKELAGMPGLPKSPQGINLKARNNNWQSRKKEGIQGKAVEYHINSLPDSVRHILMTWEDSPQYRLMNSSTVEMNKADPFGVWISAYNQLTPEERQKIISLIVRIGVRGLIDVIDRFEAE